DEDVPRLEAVDGRDALRPAHLHEAAQRKRQLRDERAAFAGEEVNGRAAVHTRCRVWSAVLRFGRRARQSGVTRSPPASFAAYRARSAACSSASADVPCSPQVASPTLNVRPSVAPAIFRSIKVQPTSTRTRSAASQALPRSESGSTTANSSPP